MAAANFKKYTKVELFYGGLTLGWVARFWYSPAFRWRHSLAPFMEVCGMNGAVAIALVQVELGMWRS